MPSQPDRGPSGTGHDTARARWSRNDAAHGSRIRMILDGPDKGSWVAWCADCDWTNDDPMPPRAAGEAARKHEDEARHAYEPDPPVAVPGPASEPTCHCGRVVEPRDPDPWEGRMDAYCYDCATNRCDCYPDECPVKHPAPGPASVSPAEPPEATEGGTQ